MKNIHANLDRYDIISLAIDAIPAVGIQAVHAAGELTGAGTINALTAGDGTMILPAGFAVPASVRDLLHQRLAQVNETERQLLQTAAAIGHSFNLPLVQAASGRSDDETVTALETLVARGLLVVGQLPRRPCQFGNGRPGANPADR